MFIIIKRYFFPFFFRRHSIWKSNIIIINITSLTEVVWSTFRFFIPIFIVIQICKPIFCMDFKRFNAFKVCPWKYKGVPNNVNQLEMHLSKEDDQVGEQININTLEFDGSNTFVRRLVLDHDCI